MKKETFVSIINAIEKQKEKDRKTPKIIEVVTALIIDALKTEMCDSDWIDYYMYKLDFGRKDVKLKAYDENGVEIPLSTPEDLYDLLEKNNRHKDEKRNKI